MNTQGWSPLGWTGWISLQSKGLSRVFSNTTVQKHQFFGTQPSLWSNSHIHIWQLDAWPCHKYTFICSKLWGFSWSGSSVCLAQWLQTGPQDRDPQDSWEEWCFTQGRLHITDRRITSVRLPVSTGNLLSQKVEYRLPKRLRASGKADQNQPPFHLQFCHGQQCFMHDPWDHNLHNLFFQRSPQSFRYKMLSFSVFSAMQPASPDGSPGSPANPDKAQEQTPWTQANPACLVAQLCLILCDPMDCEAC